MHLSNPAKLDFLNKLFFNCHVNEKPGYCNQVRALEKPPGRFLMENSDFSAMYMRHMVSSQLLYKSAQT